MRKDEAYNIKGKKVRVKVVGFYDKKNHLINEYFIFYDEDEVYHIEDCIKEKIVYTFSCNSMVKAIKFSLEYLSFQPQRGFERFKKLYNEENKELSKQIKAGLMKPEEFLVSYTKSELAEMYLRELAFNKLYQDEIYKLRKEGNKEATNE